MPIHRYPGGVINADNVTPGANQASGVWTLESQLQANGTGFWPQSTSQMSRSLRFNSADSAYLDRTPAVASNRKTWTWSAWVKRSTISTLQALQTVQDGGTEDSIAFLSGDIIRAYFVGIGGNGVVTNAVFRDPSAWYHIVVAMDTTQATASNRTKIYVNGVDLTSSSSNYLSQNADTKFNGVFPHFLGRYANQSMPTGNFNGYMTEVVFVDGQALAPTAFGYTDSNNVWQPKPYSGSVGTNGFYLTFADNTGVTPTALGKDYSNRGNNWTPFNFSVASGAGNDSLVDVPTNWGTDTGLGGEVRGNYCTLNPLNGTGTISNGNLDIRATAATWVNAPGTILVTSGKWYWEITKVGADYSMIGVGTNLASKTTDYGIPTETWTYFNNGNKYGAGTSGGYGASYTNGDVIGVALDMDAGTVTFYKNGVSQGTAYSTGLSGKIIGPWVGAYNNNIGSDSNFGQRPFAYTAPSGFKALCTQNLPTPTVQNGGQYFNPVLYTGNGSTQTVSGVGFQPDLVWNKQRSSSVGSNWLNDAVRTAGYSLSSDRTDAEADFRSYFTAFNSDGFSLAGGTDGFNANAATYVAWNWNAGGSNATNTNGSLTSTVRANTTAGFSVVTYTGNTAANQTVGHGLGVAPSMIIAKCRSIGSTNWVVYHVSLGGVDKLLILNNTNAVTTISEYWGSAAPTSTVFGVKGGGYDNNNGNMVAYCFAAVAGYSAFGSYTANASADGPFIYTGFRPAFILIKRSSVAGAPWSMVDLKRNTYNAVTLELDANATDVEFTAGSGLDFVSNGFKLRDASYFNSSNGNTFIYAAFAENPFKIARAR